jgi:hypothetical protein
MNLNSEQTKSALDQCFIDTVRHLPHIDAPDKLEQVTELLLMAILSREPLKPLRDALVASIRRTINEVRGRPPGHGRRNAMRLSAVMCRKSLQVARIASKVI